MSKRDGQTEGRETHTYSQREKHTDSQRETCIQTERDIHTNIYIERSKSIDRE